MLGKTSESDLLIFEVPRAIGTLFPFQLGLDYCTTN